MARLSQAILSALAVSILSASASAAPVALIDVGKVFKNYSGFSNSLDKMKAEVKAFEQELNTQRTRLQSQGQALQELQPGTPDYKQREQALARKLADMRVEMELKRKEMLEKEAKLYHAVYQQIVGVVQRISSERKIGIVLRYDSEEGDPTDRASVMRYVNRTAVYSHPSLDITNEVIKRLGGAAPSTAQAPQRGATQRGTTQRGTDQRGTSQPRQATRPQVRPRN